MPPEAVNLDQPGEMGLALMPEDNQRLANLCGQFDEHLHYLEKQSGIQINRRGHDFMLQGEANKAAQLKRVLVYLYELTAQQVLTMEDIHLAAREHLSQGASQKHESQQATFDDVEINTHYGKVKGRGLNQRRYLHNIVHHDINFGVGPAGTGKTYLAVACAVDALERDEVRRIILVRPAVEAGERLGFLPGDLSQKVDPYLRPLYDALFEMMGTEKVERLVERNTIEIAPLAYMRGRTLNDSFIILDEAQNTTVEQMKMFLTRIGFGSTAVVTGDVTQIDLPREQQSGLKQALKILKDVQGVSFIFFESCDVVRHPLVQRIVDAYEKFHRAVAKDNDD